MKAKIIHLFQRYAVRPRLVPLYTHLYKLSLRGLGVLNSEGSMATGEAWVMAAVKPYLPVKTVCDVGANEGGYTAELMDYFPKAEFFCFEPNPETFKLLSARHQTKNVTLYNVAVSNQVGKTTLFDFADNAPLKPTQPTATFASLEKSVITDFHHQPAKAYAVKMVTLDSWAKKIKANSIDWLKIDTEGHELSVLQGASSLIRRRAIHLIQFEFNDMHAYTHTFVRDIFTLLPAYRFFRLLPYGWLSLDKYRPLTHEVFGFQNIVALSPAAAKRLKPIIAK